MMEEEYDTFDGECDEEVVCSHENVVPSGDMCPMCGSEMGYCEDCGAELVREGCGDWEEL